MDWVGVEPATSVSFLSSAPEFFILQAFYVLLLLQHMRQESKVRRYQSISRGILEVHDN